MTFTQLQLKQFRHVFRILNDRNLQYHIKLYTGCTTVIMLYTSFNVIVYFIISAHQPVDVYMAIKSTVMCIATNNKHVIFINSNTVLAN